MKKTYIAPNVYVQPIVAASIVASSMYLSNEPVRDVDELAVKEYNWSNDNLQWEGWETW